MELYFGAGSTMFCLNGITGGIEWRRDFNSGIVSCPALADVDGDGLPEVVFGGYDRVLRALNAMTGAPVWAYPCPNNIYSSPAVADIDNDGRAEVVFGCNDGRLYAVDYNF
jgi:outer membrane protein assembly factor BamB